MTREEALDLIPEAGDEDYDPQTLPTAALRHLTAKDIPEGVSLSVGDVKDGMTYMAWDGEFFVDGGELKAACRYLWTRKYWEGPLGMPFYLDLIKRSVENRQRTHSDVTFLEWDDDGAYIRVEIEMRRLPEPLDEANAEVRKRLARLEEDADRVSEEVGKMVAGAAQKLSGWGELSLHQLVDAVEAAKSTDEKGRVLEELTARIFSEIPGFSVQGRVRTETEEIDISILNGSGHAIFQREEAFILAECKNWSGVCGKNEFVIFKEKLENRGERCSLGFLVSWNGFAGTIEKEMLRGSKQRVLVVPVDGETIRRAVASERFEDVIAEAVKIAAFV